MADKGRWALRRGWLVVVLLGALVLPAEIVTPSGSGSYPPPASGDWIITQDTNISNEPIYLNGNLTVQNGSLNLTQLTLYGNVTGASLSITVAPNCSFTAQNCLFEAGNNSELLFDFQGTADIQVCSFTKAGGEIVIRPGNATRMHICEVEGTIDIPDFAMPNMSDVTIHNSSVGIRWGAGARLSSTAPSNIIGEEIYLEKCNWGVICEPGCTVSGCTFAQCGLGILLSDNVNVTNCFFTGCQAGILASTGAAIAASANVSDCVLDSCIQGISLGPDSRIDNCSLFNCNITTEVLDGPVEISDSYLAGNGTHLVVRAGRANATNTTFSPDHVDIDDGAELEVRWYVDASVLYNNDTPVRNASMQITNCQGQSFKEYTGPDGKISTRLFKEYLRKQNGAMTCSPYWFNASKDGLTCNMSVNVNRSMDLKMVLGDSSAPAIAITSPANGSLLNTSTVTLNGSASDESGNVSVRVRVDSGAWVAAGGAGNWSIPLNLTDGTHIIEAEAMDNASNNASAFVAVTIDTVPPSVMIMSPKQGALINKTSIELTGMTEPGAALRIDGEVVPVSLGAFWLDKQLCEGPNNISLVARDAAGNSAAAALLVTVDTIAPVLTVSAPANGSVLGKRDVAVFGTSEAGAEIYLAGARVASAGPFFSFNTTLSEGESELEISAVDLAGNRNTTCVMVTVDSQAPFIEVELSNGTVTRVESITVTGRTEPGADLSINGLSVPVAANGSFRAAVSLRAGNNTISFFVRDAAGNTIAQQRIIVREAPAVPGPDGGAGGSKSSWKQEWTAAIIISVVAIILLVLALRPYRRFGAPVHDSGEGGR